jgi:dTDP-4-dehydrorhamnose 3,5-epimerase
MIEGLEFIDIPAGSDERGLVREFYRRSRTTEAMSGIPAEGWAQINVTESNYGAVRGLHAEQISKLVGIVSGKAFGVWIDCRPQSATFGNLVTSELAPGQQVFVPLGVLNGFQSLSSPSQYLYCFTAEWNPKMPGFGVNPLDPELAVAWPVTIDVSNRSQISAKDAAAPSWASTRDNLLSEQGLLNE